jgi:flagellar basal body-associated protein FliL
MAEEKEEKKQQGKEDKKKAKEEKKKAKKEEKEKKKQEKKGKKEGKEEKEKTEKQEDGKSEGDEKKSFIASFLPGMIIGLIVVSFAGAGFSVGRIFGGSSTPQAPGTSENDQAQNSKAKDSEDGEKNSWYYHMAPVIANLNVSDVTRYVKASLTLEISDEVDQKKFAAYLDEKQPILTNWLTVYLASLGLDDIRGDSNLKSIQAHVLDGFNEKLFPDSKPQIKHILFKEFAVQ